VRVNRVEGEEEDLADLSFGQAVGEVAENLELALGEVAVNLRLVSPIVTTFLVPSFVPE